MRQKFLLSVVTVAVALTAPGRVAFAQNYLYATGNPTFGVNIPIENGYINIANGNVHLEVSLASSAQRGDLQLNERLVYDSRIWQIVNNGTGYHWQPTNVPNSMAGWRFVNGGSGGQVTSTLSQYTCTNLTTDQQYPAGEYTFSWTDDSGTLHPFDAIWGYQDPNCSPEQQQTNSGTATDATGYSMVMTGYSDNPPDTITIYDKNWNQVYPSAVDRFGNFWSQDANGNLIDDLGRTPVTATTSGNQITYNVLTFGGGSVPYTVTTESIPIATNFGQSGVSEFSGSITAIQSIQLPDGGGTYTFTYDPDGYGEMLSMTPPTGGVVNLGYTNYLDSYQNENRWLNGYVGGHGSLSFYPSVVTNCSGPTETGCVEQVKETTATGDDTIYTLTLNNGAWNTEEDVYQGPVSGGHQLVSVSPGYNFSIPCPAGTCTGAEDVTKQTVATTLSDVGLTTQTAYGYNNPQTALPISVEQWDYYTAAPSGSPAVNTEYTYDTGNDLQQVQVFDGSGNQVALTNYNFSATATPTSGVPGHSAPNPSGLSTPYLGSVAQWAGGSNTLTTSFTTDDTGTELTSTDPNGQTTFGHDSTDTYLTGLTPPTPSSGVSLPQSATYDPSTGLLTSTTDPNGAVTSYPSYDWAGRPAQINYPDGGVETFTNYSPNDRGDSRTMNASTSTQTRTLVDGYGRPSRVAVFNGQSANQWYQNDYCYDADGRLQFESYRYQGNGWGTAIVCSGAGDTYSYDALNRVTQVLHGDGTSVNYQYRGRATEVTDENGVSRISQVDGLGRTTAVCEISSNSSMPGSGSPTSCGMDISGTGFLTTYAYSLASHTTQVTQGVQTRTFQTDALGRMISVQEPESGTTTYSYAYNGTGLVVTRSRPQANQTNPSVLTTTTTQYDAVGRVVGVTYSDGITPYKAFVYDTAQGGFGWDQAPNATNLKGRLAVMGAETSAANLTGALFSYDAMGRVVGMWQCGPSICGTSSQGTRYLGFSYDWTGNLTGESDPVSGAIVYSRSPAGEVTSIANQSYTIENAYNPGVDNPLVPAVQNGPFGPTSYNLANGLGTAVQYDSLGRLNGTYVCVGSPEINCSGETEQYAFWILRQGQRINEACYGPCAILGYDEFNRLISSNLADGEQAFSYAYDRYGNRWAQNVTSGSGPSWSASFNAQTNQIVGYGYDAAGNVTNDGSHAYQYDAEGNLLTVDAGNTATYVYDAMNRRVGVANAAGNNELSYDYAGRRISTWPIATNAAIEGRIYWDGQQIAYHSNYGLTYFEHQDWEGTERARTDPWGNLQAGYASLAFGDGNTQTVGGTTVNQDNNSFTSLELDPESETYHAQYRQYGPGAGSWMSPDPYAGSYDINNPQSFNRYSYVLNNPLTFTDPSGQDACLSIIMGVAAFGEGGEAAAVAGCAVEGAIGLYDLFSGIFSGGPSFHGSLQPRPGVSDPGSFGESLGIPTSIPQGNWGIGMALNLPSEACEFGACGPGPSSLTPGQTAQLGGPILIPPTWMFGLLALFHHPNNGPYPTRMFGTHWCGPGGAGPTVNGLDAACQAHDLCYGAHGFTSFSNWSPYLSPLLSQSQEQALQQCNQALCNAASQSNDPGSTRVQMYFTSVSAGACAP